MAKSDQLASIVDMKNTLTGELRSVGGSISMSKETLAGASAANAEVEKIVWEMQDVVRSLDAYMTGCSVQRLTVVVQFPPGLWRSWDMWSADLGQAFRM